MSSRLRSLGSTRISFFAFQDIITSVSGILILVTLILATDIRELQTDQGQDADTRLQEKLLETLTLQRDVDQRIRDLQELLVAADTAPSVEKLQADIQRLQAELEDETRSNRQLADRLAAMRAANEERDRRLGITGASDRLREIRDQIAATKGELDRLRERERLLEKDVLEAQAVLLKLKGQQGKLWLIPDKKVTTKTPVLAVVSGNGVRLEEFNKPEASKEFHGPRAEAQFRSHLDKYDKASYYLVFLVRPSGIGLFDDLSDLSRKLGFEVGFDALDENVEVRFQEPPPLVPPEGGHGSTNPAAPPSVDPPPPTTPPAATPPPGPTAKPPPPPPAPKSWWQRLLEYIGIR